jgi:hypothetical protein
MSVFRRADLYRRAHGIRCADAVTQMAELTVDSAAPQAGFSRPSRSKPARAPSTQTPSIYRQLNDEKHVRLDLYSAPIAFG